MIAGRKFSRLFTSCLKVFTIVIGLAGATAEAQISCPAASLGIPWTFVAIGPGPGCNNVPATAPTGNYISVSPFLAAARVATLAALQAQNPTCTGIAIPSAWGGSGCYDAPETFNTPTPCGHLDYAAATMTSPAGVIGTDVNMYVNASTEALACVPGTGWGGSGTIAWNKTVGQVNLCTDQQCQEQGDPISASTGNVFLKQTDYAPAVFGGLLYERYYNSNPNVMPGRLGPGWRDTFDRMILMSNQIPTSAAYTGQNLLLVLRPDGRIVTFSVSGTTATPTDPDAKSSLTISGSVGYYTYTYYDEDNTVETYTETSGSPWNHYGQLTSLKIRGGQRLTMTYSSVAGLQALTKVSDDFGHTLTFTLDSTSGNVTQMTDTAGNIYSYTYNSQSYLSGITFPGPTPGSPTGGVSRTYAYVAVGSAYALNTLTDENGSIYDTWTYDTSGRATANYHGSSTSPQNGYTLTYPGSGPTTVVDGAGVSTAYSFTTYNGVPKYSSIVVNGTLTTSSAYNSAGQQTSMTDPKGNVTSRVFNARNLETSRTEAVGTSSARTIATTWHATFRLPLTISVYPNSGGTGTASRVTTNTYDGQGNLLTMTVNDPVNSVSRTSTYTYDNTSNNGHLLTIDGPRTDVTDTTTFTYYSCTTGAQCGQLQTVTDALGHVTTYNTYNANGVPLTITDPNGLVTTLTYDNLNRVLTQAIGTNTTSISYTPTNQMLKVTRPNSAFIQFSYDAAHRVTKMLDADGDYVSYSLSPMGIRTAENVYDSSNTLRRNLTRTVDSYGRVSAQYGAAGTSAVETSYAYDNVGNISTITAPLARITLQGFDPLNRLTKQTNAAGGVTTDSFDALDQLYAVTDPRGNATTVYVKNNLGDLLGLYNSDATWHYTYDSGGNVAVATSYGGPVATNTYDALNRRTLTSYSGPHTTYTDTLTYDTAANGIGRIASANNSAAPNTLTFSYDSLGEVSERDQVVLHGEPALINKYYYTNGDLSQVTTPANNNIYYGYTNGKITSVTVNSTTLISNITYEPFGGPSGWTWGNGTTEVRSHDADGRISQVGGPEILTLAYDNASRLTTSTNAANSGLSWAYAYDALDRLTSAAQGGATATAWTYDANGNRLTQTNPSMSYSYATQDNRIQSGPGGTFNSDGSGNVVSGGTSGMTWNYQNAGNLMGNYIGSLQTGHGYNGLEQLTGVSSNAAGEIYGRTYDESGHLLGEYSSTSALIQETVWLGDIPVATIQPNGTSVAVYYVHTDQLEAPRLITNPSTNAIVWRWDTDPWGTLLPTGSLTYNLRFPGQHYNSESGLFDNGPRDYNPSIGRYMESDPIGFSAGVNTYTYANNNPITHFDASGLDCQSANGRTICNFPGGPSFNIATPPGFKDYIGPRDFLYHSYQVNAAEDCSDSDMMQALINDPAPGDPISPATPGRGTPNTAHTLGFTNSVNSITTTDLNTGQPLVVNVTTGSGYFDFHPGYVARSVSNGVVHTYGEGESAWQSPWLFSGQFLFDQGVWRIQTYFAAKQCGCSK